MYISEIIGENYKIWNQGTQVLLHATTGMGKTFFILNKLLPFAIEMGREILYLSNRRLLDAEIVSMLCKSYGIDYELMAKSSITEFKGITVMTYQTLQQMIKGKGWSAQIPPHYYLVADEFHYFTSDSEFSPEVYDGFRWFMNSSSCVKIMISATPEDIGAYIFDEAENWEFQGSSDLVKMYSRRPKYFANVVCGISEKLLIYKGKSDRNNFCIFAYDSLDEIADAIAESDSEEKWLIFTSNIKNARKSLENKIDADIAFISASEGDCKVKSNLVTQNSFEEKVLVATKVIDNGISLKDEKIKNLVIEASDRTDFMQMLGRHRNESNQPCKLYIPKRAASYFAGIIHLQINPALELMERPPSEVLNIALADNRGRELVKQFYYVKDGKLRLNPIAKNQLTKKKEFFVQMKEKMENNPKAFIEEQLSWMGYETTPKVVDLSESVHGEVRKAFETLLELSVNVTMDKNGQEKFRHEATDLLNKLWPEKVKKHRTIGLKTINSAIKELGFNYEICVKGGKKKGEKTTWEVKTKA